MNKLFLIALLFIFSSYCFSQVRVDINPNLKNKISEQLSKGKISSDSPITFKLDSSFQLTESERLLEALKNQYSQKDAPITSKFLNNNILIYKPEGSYSIRIAETDSTFFSNMPLHRLNK